MSPSPKIHFHYTLSLFHNACYGMTAILIDYPFVINIDDIDYRPTSLLSTSLLSTSLRPCSPRPCSPRPCVPALHVRPRNDTPHPGRSIIRQRTRAPPTPVLRK